MCRSPKSTVFDSLLLPAFLLLPYCYFIFTLAFNRTKTVQKTRFVLPLIPLSPHCRPQGTRANFTTAPLPCQIRQSLFFIRFSFNNRHSFSNRQTTTPSNKSQQLNTRITQRHNHLLYHSLPMQANPQHSRKSHPLHRLNHNKPVITPKLNSTS